MRSASECSKCPPECICPRPSSRQLLGSDGRRQFARNISGEILHFAELPTEFQGRFRHSCRQVLEVRHEAVNSHDELMGKRAWKAFLLLPLLLLRRPGNERKVSKEDLRRWFDCSRMGRGRFWWTKLWQTLPVPVKPRSEGGLSAEQRRQKAAQKVLMGEITRARQCLTGAPSVQRKRPQEVVRELSEHVRAFALDTPLALSKKILLKSLKSSPRGSSPGPGGRTYEHLKVLMDDVDTFNLLHEAVTSLAQARVPASISKVLTMARLTALTKKDGGVRGIATGCSMRRLTARTLAKQFAKDFESQCAPFQYALSIRAGTDCVDMLRAATDVTPNATVLSVDGVGVYDHVLRAAMLWHECRTRRPFSHSFCCRVQNLQSMIGTMTKDDGGQ